MVLLAQSKKFIKFWINDIKHPLNHHILKYFLWDLPSNICLSLILVFNKHLGDIAKLHHYSGHFLQVRDNHRMCILCHSGFSRGSRTPYWGLEQSPSWMPASSRRGKSSGGEGPAGPWHRDGHRVRSADQTSRPKKKLHITAALLLIFLLSPSQICS